MRRCYKCGAKMLTDYILCEKCEKELNERMKKKKMTREEWSIKDVADTFKKYGLITEQEPCDDAISREDAIEAIASIDDTDGEVAVFTGKQVIAILKDLPPVTQKSAKDYLDMADRKAKKIKDALIVNCGCRMVEPQESEVRNDK